ncbi:MAG: C4-type zinc ribbon domain-containing protein [Thermodesulfovibrionales bacterium]
MNEALQLLITLQQTDTRIIEKRRFIDTVPLRINEVDAPLKLAAQELEKVKQRNEGIAKKKRDKERAIEEISEKIKKMKARAGDIKTNKEYLAHQKEIESSEMEIRKLEDDILLIMEETEGALRDQKEREARVREETAKIDAFRKELESEVARHEETLAGLKKERAGIVARIDAELYKRYRFLLETCNGLAIARAANEICLGCDMNIPPQLYAEIKKNDEIHTCPQCRRILYYEES